MQQKMYLEDIFKLFYTSKASFSLFESLSIEENYKKRKLKSRTFYSCTPELKIIHDFLNRFLFTNIPFHNDVVFSYRKGVNVVDCLLPHTNNYYLYRTDIKDFFSSIDRDTIRESILSNKEKINYLQLSEIDKYIERILDFVTVDQVLPIGFSTSPIISNFVMYKIDCEISNFCNKNRYSFTRYSDDIIISSNEPINASSITEELSSIFYHNNEKLNINEDKTKLFSKRQRKNVLGVIISPQGDIRVKKEIKREVEIGIYLFLNNKERFKVFFRADDISSKRILGGKLSYISSIEPEYIDKLIRKFGNRTITYLMKWS